MNDSPSNGPLPSGPTSRTEQFQAEIADLKLKTGKQDQERIWVILGGLMMALGIGLALAAYAASLNVTATPASNVDVLNSNSYVVLAVAGLAVALVGGLVFVRYSFARFLRFWLLRQSYEQRQALDQAIQGRVTSEETP